MIRVLDRYLFKQVALTLIFSVVLFTVIWLAPETLFKLIQKIGAGELPVARGLWLFILHIPPVLQQVLPMAAFLGAFFVFRRLSQEFEVVAMMGQGISPARIALPVAAVGLAALLVHVGVQEFLTPETAPALDRQRIAYGLDSGREADFVFVEKTDHGALSRFLFIGNIGTVGKDEIRAESHNLSDFIVLEYGDDPFQQETATVRKIIQAPRGWWDNGEQGWVLDDVTVYHLDEAGVYRDVTRHYKYTVPMSNYAAKLLRTTAQNPLSLSWGGLNRLINLLNAGGQTQDVPFYAVRLWQKAAVPVGTMVLALLGAWIGMEAVRSRRSYNLTMAALLLFAYAVTVPFATNLASAGLVPAWLMVWLPIGVVILLTLLYKRVFPYVMGA